MYKLGKIPFGSNEPICVCHTPTNTWIPFNQDNTDYQQYLKWLAEGNTPEPADE